MLLCSLVGLAAVAVAVAAALATKKENCSLSINTSDPRIHINDNSHIHNSNPFGNHKLLICKVKKQINLLNLHSNP